jgi:hypothetical protein
MMDSGETDVELRSRRPFWAFYSHVSYLVEECPFVNKKKECPFKLGLAQ